MFYSLSGQVLIKYKLKNGVFTEMSIKQGFFDKVVKKFQPKAEKLSKDKNKTSQLINKASKKALKNEHSLKSIWGSIQLFIDMLKDWIKGDYKNIPYKTLLMILIGLIYFVSPVDFIPDFILGLGLVDDVAVITFLMRGIRSDLETYQNWKEQNKNVVYTIDYSKIQQ